MPLSAKIDVPGYTVKTSADGKQLFLEYGIGHLWDNPEPNINLGPHTITIMDETGATIANLSVPEKQWRTHFRYPWAKDKVLLTPKDLVDQKLMFMFGNPGAMLHAVPDVVYDGPNAFPGMTRSWGDTGERAELGLLSEWAARFMMTGNTTNMMQIAEGAGTAPVFFQDEHTGKPISRVTYPNANNFGYGPQYHGMPWFPASPTPDNDRNVISVAMNHAPEPSYLAALVTRNGWHLRNLQHWANYILLNNGSVSADKESFVTVSEQRSLAWGLRTFGMAHVATREFERLGILPDDCLPSSYFATVLSATRKHALQPFMDNPELQLTRIAWSEQAFAPWQQCYILEALGFLVLTGHSEFNDFYLWNLGNVVAQTSGKTGWPPGLPCSYWVYIGEPGARLKSWGEIWNAAKQPVKSPGGQVGNIFTQAMCDALDADPFNGGKLADDSQGEYFESSHGVLSAALHLHGLGIVDVVAAYPELPTCYANVHRMVVNLDAAQNPWLPGRRWFFNNRSAIIFNPMPDMVIRPSPVGLSRR